MTDQRAAFIDHMRAHGIGPADPAEIIADDKRRRYRIEGDKPKKRNGTYQLKIDGDGFAVGWCQSFKEGETRPWHSRVGKKLSDEEKAEFKRRAAEAKAAREAEEKRQQEHAAKIAARRWDAANKSGSTPYLDRKQIDLHGARISGQAILVPLRVGGDLLNLQTIHPDGEKRFIYGGRKKGAYFSIAKRGDDMRRIVICEGYATGCSIRVALACPVIVAFDAGNLKPVAQAIRKKYRDAEIVIAADNDQWSQKQDGTPWNPGIEKARQAAVAVGGARVIAPRVPEDDPAQRTDWNDIATTDGLGTIVEAFSPAGYDDAPPPEMPPEDFGAPIYGAGPDPLEEIRPLGHNRGSYYFFPRTAGQIVSLSATGMGRIQNLYMLAPRRFWKTHYGDSDTSDTKICAFASAHLMQACHDRGIFEAENTRGVGVWIDRGRVVVNTGDAVICEGERWLPAEFNGEHVYESGPKVINMDAPPLLNKEAAGLRKVCHMLLWKRGIYADLLAGWLVVASVGSALDWRPHIWITGQSGAGKTTVLDHIIKPVLGSAAVRRDGGTTESGVRKALGVSGRPFILDEAESEKATDRAQMEKIIGFVRKASSGGVIENFNSSFQARSCFCFSAINPRVEESADKSRITQLEMMVDKSEDREVRFNNLLATIHEAIPPEFSKRLLARTVENMQTLLQNCRTFSLAASAVMGNKRTGDQFGPMLAGAYLLTSTKRGDYEFACKWMAEQDWHWGITGEDEADCERLVQKIATYRIGYDVEGIRRESTIGDLITYAAANYGDHQDAAIKGLKPYGIKVLDGRIYIANQSPQLRKVLADTPWVPWNRTLGDYPGADNAGGKAIYFAPGLVSRATSIPLEAVLREHENEPPEADEPGQGDISW